MISYMCEKEVAAYLALDINDQSKVILQNKSFIKLVNELDKKGIKSEDYIISYKFKGE